MDRYLIVDFASRFPQEEKEKKKDKKKAKKERERERTIKRRRMQLGDNRDR